MGLFEVMWRGWALVWQSRRCGGCVGNLEYIGFLWGSRRTVWGCKGLIEAKGDE